MKITNCNTQELVVCGCTLTFSSYVANSVSRLDVGNLLGGSCTFTSYVIDWYRNGIKALVSGTNGASTDIQAVHPFTGNAAITVQGGTWVPVVRWVVIGGIKYYSQPTKCKKWCSTLTGLPTINVSTVGCGVNTGTPSSGYDSKLAYISTSDYTLASRVFNYYLSDDLLTKYLVVKFSAYSVNDRIKIFWKDDLVPIANRDVSVGTAQADNYTATPKVLNASSLVMVMDVPAYSIGDFFRIEIIPSYLSTNYNTNWDVEIKCLTAASAYDNTVFSNYIRPTWNQLAVTYNAAACSARITINSTPMSPQPASRPYLTSYVGGWDTQTPFNATTGVGYYDIPLGYGYSQTYYRNNYYNGKYALAGTLNVTKVGNQLTLTYSNSADYDLWVSEWLLLIASPVYTQWATFNNTQLSYYTFICFPFWLVTTTCGDTSTRKLLYTRPDCTVTYANNVVNITLVHMGSNYISTEACMSSIRSQANSQISYTNSNGSDFNLNTVCRDGAQSWSWRYDMTTRPTTIDTSIYKRFMNSEPFYSLWSMPAPTFCRFNPNALMFWYLYYYQIKLLNLEDPANNFEIYDLIKYTDGCNLSSGTGPLIYKVANGVRTFPL